MISDDERREVARRLRELASDAEEVSDFDLAKTLDLDAVSRYGYDPRDVDRLADLIEPDTTTDTTKSPELTTKCDRDTPQKAAEEMFGKMRHSMRDEADAYDAMLKSMSVEIHPVDRDALLALADEMEEFGNLPVKHPGIRVLHNDDFSRELGYARRIRTALGVDDA